MESQEITPRDEMLHIMRVIWTSRKPEQLKGCQNMIDTFASAFKRNVGNNEKGSRQVKRKQREK